MGTDIDQEEFDERNYSRFRERLGECLSALGQLLERPGFGVGPATVGAELELFLVDGAARPLRHNQAIRAAVADPRVTVELDRFNLELNASPALLAGRPFAALGGELNVLLDHVAGGARDHAGRLALIGILPTLSQADLGPGVMTDVPRYRALNSGLRRLRQDPFDIRIAGEDPLELAVLASGESPDSIAAEARKVAPMISAVAPRWLSRSGASTSTAPNAMPASIVSHRPVATCRSCTAGQAARRPCGTGPGGTGSGAT